LFGVLTQHIQFATWALLLLAATCVPSGTRCAADTFTWTGASPNIVGIANIWGNPLNWQNNQVPVNDGTADIIIPDTPRDNSNVNQPWSIKSLLFQGAANLSVNDDPLTFSWSFVSLPPGSNATLSNPAIVAPTFVADVPGTFVIQLIVNDGLQNSVPDFVQIHTNGPPIASAGPDQNVPVGSIVQLNGAASSDPEASPLTYQWILNTRPAGSSAVLSNPNIVNPTFVADLPGTYIAQLVVNDGLVNSASDTVTITTQNLLPIANAGPDQSNIALNATVALDGSASSDPEGTPVTYAWTFVLRPSGSTAVFINPTTATPTFVADRGGRYRIQLIVRDGLADSAPDTVDVTTVNQPPTANAGPDQTVPEDTLVTLNGTGSTDPDTNPLTYAWSFVTMKPSLLMINPDPRLLLRRYCGPPKKSSNSGDISKNG
jgi:hypothetical protein